MTPDLPSALAPMLATPGPVPVDDGSFAAEVKWDGVRVLAWVRAGGVRLTTRNGNDVTASFPELGALAGTLGARHAAVLDGEVVAIDPSTGRSSFGLLQSRTHVLRPTPALLAGTPVRLVVFDVLHLDDASLLGLTYDQRRGELERLDIAGPHVDVPQPLHGPLQAIQDASRQQQLEGIVYKRRDSTYLPGRRSRAWVKTKNIHEQTAVVGGWTPGERGRAGRIGALLLGVHGPAGLEYIGKVGTGFTERTLDLLKDRFAPLTRTTSPFTTPLPRTDTRQAVWLEPVTVVECAFSEWTRDGRLRHPAFKGIREDYDPAAVTRESG